jgi:hypothetical protein
MIKTVQVLFILALMKPTIFVSIKLILWKKHYSNRFNLFGFLMITETKNFRFFFINNVGFLKQLIHWFFVFLIVEIAGELLFQFFVVISI